MDFKQLQSFVTVVQEESFTQAAGRLFVSQSTVSTHIHQLESELNTKLILRTTKSLQITPKGRELYEYALNILELKERMIQACSIESRRIIHLGASTIPSACAMIPSALITYFYPKIVWTYSADAPNFPKFIRKLTGLFTAINFVVFLGLIVMAPLAIWLIYGEKYMNVLPVFRVLSFNYFVYGSTHMLFGNVIAAMKKSEVNLAIAVASGILNILLNLTLIPRMGSIGAAIATVCVSISLSLMNGICLKKEWRKINNPDIGTSE